MLSRRHFNIALIASLGLLHSCAYAYRKQLPGLTGDIAKDATTFTELGITKVTTGFVGVAAYVFFAKSFDDETIAAPLEEELIEHARLVRRNVEELLAEQFEIIDSVAYEDSPLYPNTAIINWRKLAKIKKNFEQLKDKVVAQRYLLVLREMLGKDYQYIRL